MVTDCPKCKVRLQDLGTPVPWCDRCAWTPPETAHIDVPLPDIAAEEAAYEGIIVPLEPERFAGDADAVYYRRVRLPEQNADPIRRVLHESGRVGKRFRNRWIDKKLDRVRETA